MYFFFSKARFNLLSFFCTKFFLTILIFFLRRRFYQYKSINQYQYPYKFIGKVSSKLFKLVFNTLFIFNQLFKMSKNILKIYIHLGNNQNWLFRTFYH